MSPAQVELREATAAKRAVDDFKRSLGIDVAPATNGSRPVTGHGMTLAQIDAMPMHEWNAIPKEDRQRILDDAHRMGR